MSEENYTVLNCVLCQNTYRHQHSKPPADLKINDTTYTTGACDGCKKCLKNKHIDLEHFNYLFKKRQEAQNDLMCYLNRTQDRKLITVTFYEGKRDSYDCVELKN